MNRSFNSNIRYNGKIYHIQTEIYSDKVVTQIFDGGKIINSIKSPFVDFKTTVSQHKKVEQAVLKGNFLKDDKTF
ncbi:MAG: hypothetical protein PWQ25_1667 [Deferribacteres bacterium]|jgi:hypothetical protein|nr:hypothetical protein [Deferribacteraceae bacterium]MDK2792804.1 hypothetical protein [Deferribacteres bacterium]